MKHFHGIHNLSAQGILVASVGMFDGVHLGHKGLLERLRKKAKELGGSYALVTFWPPPRHVIAGKLKPLLLSVEEERAEQLAALRLSQLITLPFDAKFASYDPTFFLEEILIKGIGVGHLIVGADHRFGKGGAGSLSDLQLRAQNDGFSVEVAPVVKAEGEAINSTRIRAALSNGDLDLANRLLGYTYVLSGIVEKGEQLGRKLGFPTANLRVPEEKLLPLAGVYAVDVQAPSGKIYDGMLYIGKKYVGGQFSETVEVNVFDLPEMSLYGQKLRLQLYAYVRGELHFATKSALSTQIASDKEHITDIFRQKRKK